MRFFDPRVAVFLQNFSEIRTGPATVNDLVVDTLVDETEMAGRLAEGRVADRILDDDLVHSVPVLWIARPYAHPLLNAPQNAIDR
jgi:hypothetical protein